MLNLLGLLDLYDLVACFAFDCSCFFVHFAVLACLLCFASLAWFALQCNGMRCLTWSDSLGLAWHDFARLGLAWQAR